MRSIVLAASLLSTAELACERKEDPSSTAPTPPRKDPEPPAPLLPIFPEKAPWEPEPDPVPAPQETAPTPPKAEDPPRKLVPPDWWEDRENFYVNAKDLIRQGRKKEALEVLEDVLALDPTHKAAVIDKAEIYRELGRSEEMIPDLEAALLGNPGDPTLLQELALSHLAGGRADEALTVIEQAITDKDAVPGARYAKAVILAEMKDAEGALRALSDAVKNGYLNLGVFEKEDRFRFIADDPRYQEALAAMRKFQEAVRAARRPAGETVPR